MVITKFKRFILYLTCLAGGFIFGIPIAYISSVVPCEHMNLNISICDGHPPRILIVGILVWIASMIFIANRLYRAVVKKSM